jgi:protein TonB
MFEQSLVRAEGCGRRPAAVALSLALQAAGIGALALVPLWRYAALPAPAEAAVVAPPAMAAPAATSKRAPPTRAIVRLAADEAPALTPPAAIPTMAAARTPTHPLPGAPMGVAGGAGSGPPAAWLGAMRSAAPAPPPAAAGMIRVGGEVQAARCMACPPPSYPALARMAGVSGVVALAAVIGTDGRVTGLRLLSGPALLVAAAIRAVRAWRYRPTQLNGKPVSVRTAIRVAFRLGSR